MSWHVAGLVAVVVGREHRRRVRDGEALALGEEAGAQRVRGAEAPARIGLHAARDVAPGDVGSDPVEDEVADLIGPVAQVGEAVEERDLVLDICARRRLVRRDGETVALALARVELRGVDRRRALQGVARPLARHVGDLEAVVRVAEQDADTAAGIEQIGEVAEALGLLRCIVDRAARRGRVLDADVVAQERTCDKVAERPLGAAQFGVGLAVAAAAAEHPHAAAVLKRIALGADVDDCCRAVAVLRWQCAGQDADAVGEARLERLAEAADRLRDDDAVDPVLDVGVVAAHVQLAIGVLHDAGRLQDDLVDRRAVAERQVRQVLPREAVDRAAGVGRERVAGGVEALARADDVDALQLLRHGRGCDRRRSGRHRLDRRRRLREQLGRKNDGRRAERDGGKPEDGETGDSDRRARRCKAEHGVILWKDTDARPRAPKRAIGIDGT